MLTYLPIYYYSIDIKTNNVTFSFKITKKIIKHVRKVNNNN